MVKNNEKIFILTIENGEDPNIPFKFNFGEVGSSSSNEDVVINIETNVSIYYIKIESI